MNPAPILTLIALMLVLRVVVRHFWAKGRYNPFISPKPREAM